MFILMNMMFTKAGRFSIKRNTIYPHPMPSPEQRLDQLEPVISEMLAKQDETAAKVERVSAQVRQLTVVVTNSLTTQSDNIEFLLTRTQQLTEGQARLDQGQSELKEQVNQGFAQLVMLINEKLK